ncbi:MAG: hypothetical protein J3Q66DRAFT_388962 [Benniella sp.]|nr:MAG: hypothetical protein J3Q66DRAFT_388962 [Benniella sp.]
MAVPGMDLFSRPAIYSQSLDHLQKPLCPRFYKYDQQKLLLLETNECTPFPSEHPEFSADICFSPFTCNEGLVRVRRRDRVSLGQTPFMWFLVVQKSSLLQTGTMQGSVFPFQISNPGKLTLDIMHLYDNYGAIVEQTDQWPVLRQQKVISNLPLEICRGCPSRVAQPRFPVSDDSEQPHEARSIRGRYQLYSIGKTRSGIGKESELPQCSRTMAVQAATTTHRIEQQVGGSTTLAFVNDPWFSKMAEKSDFLVANLGQWATGTKVLDDLWSTARYHDKIQRLVEGLQQRACDMQDFDDEDMEYARQLLGSDFGRGNDGNEEYDPRMRRESQRKGSQRTTAKQEKQESQKKLRPNRGEDRAKTDEDRPDYPPNGFLRQSRPI